MLTHEELAATWVEYHATRSPQALELLVLQYAPLARYLVRRALKRVPGHQEASDLLSYAHKGLLDALRRFEPGLAHADGKPIEFEHYATRRIAGAIIDGQREQDPLSRPSRTKVKLVQASMDSIWERTSREPTVEAIADDLGVTPAEVRETLLMQKTLEASLEAEGLENDSSVTIDGPTEVGVQMTEIRKEISRRLAPLDGAHLALLLAIYCDELSTSEAAELLGRSRTWVRGVRKELLLRLAG